MDALETLLQQIKHHLNIELSEINRRELAKFANQYRKSFKADVRPNIYKEIRKEEIKKIRKQAKREAAKEIAAEMAINSKTEDIIPRHVKRSDLKKDSRVYGMVLSALTRNRGKRFSSPVSIAQDIEQYGSIDVDEVAMIVCEVHGITLDQLKSAGQRKKTDNISAARADFARLMYHKFRFSGVFIQRYLGYKSHSAVLNYTHGAQVEIGGEVKRIPKKRVLSKYHLIEQKLNQHERLKQLHEAEQCA